MVKTRAVIVYNDMMGQSILLVSNHTIPQPNSENKIWDILLSLELASQTLTSHTTQQEANFLYRINPTKAKTSTTISHSASPVRKTFSEQIPQKRSEWRQDKTPESEPLAGLWVCHKTLNIKAGTLFYAELLVHHCKYYRIYCI